MLQRMKTALRLPAARNGAAGPVARCARRTISARWSRQSNFGDTLTPIILEYATGLRVRYSTTPGKFLAIGSIIHYAERGDILWGPGLLKDIRLALPAVEVLALRGPLTARNCGVNIDVFGDPAILLPLIYRPSVEKKHKVGIIPHYIDKNRVTGGHVIDIEAPWRKVIDAILECERIVSSSLHGIIAAEAYGIPAEWTVLSDQVFGGQFKFHDYMLGTGRQTQSPGLLPPIPDLPRRQQRLLNALRTWQST